jgi:UDP-N-acetylmuramate--alanine ligase
LRRRIQKIHFVGIGGIGMCGIAELLLSQGYRISGSDVREGPTVSRLQGLGIDVHIGHEESNLGEADVLVYSSAVKANNPEIREAEARKIPVIRRAEMLAELMRLKEGIAVGGSHGKTTTTSLIAHILDAAGLDPTAVIGGRVQAPGGDPTGARLGASDILVAEADESDGSFLRLTPAIAVITNIDPEHLDHYGSFDAVQDAFVRFANGVPFWGVTILCADHPGVQTILPRLTRRINTYGFSSQAELVADEIEVVEFGMRFRVQLRGEELGTVSLRLPGRHNIANALAAIAVAIELEVPFGKAAAALADFPGIERRFEFRGDARGIRFVDDYAHHPSEIQATLAAARAAHRGRIVSVFQPHRYSRTRDCFEDFTRSFNDTDVLIVTEIYPAGEPKIPGVEAQRLVEAIRSHGHRDTQFIADFDSIVLNLPEQLREGDLVLTLGAGNISALGPRLLDQLQGLAK